MVVLNLKSCHLNGYILLWFLLHSIFCKQLDAKTVYLQPLWEDFHSKTILKNHIKRDHEKVPVERFPCMECEDFYNTNKHELQCKYCTCLN